MIGSTPPRPPPSSFPSFLLEELLYCSLDLFFTSFFCYFSHHLLFCIPSLHYLHFALPVVIKQTTKLISSIVRFSSLSPSLSLSLSPLSLSFALSASPLPNTISYLQVLILAKSRKKQVQSRSETGEEEKDKPQGIAIAISRDPIPSCSARIKKTRNRFQTGSRIDSKHQKGPSLFFF